MVWGRESNHSLQLQCPLEEVREVPDQLQDPTPTPFGEETWRDSHRRGEERHLSQSLSQSRERQDSQPPHLTLLLLSVINPAPQLRESLAHHLLGCEGR